MNRKLKTTRKAAALIPQEIVERKIFLIRGQKVMLSPHLAELYGVETRALIQAVKRNIDRFPDDFVFQLSHAESEWLVSQNVIPHIKYLGGSLPYAFTEQVVAMLSSVLRSKRAVQVNIAIMRAFVKLRQILASHKDFAHKLNELERKFERHDSQIKSIFDAIRQLMAPPEPEPKPKIGFRQR
ncbi:MAG: ORF6N domain-containing protein [Planctomycetes bacterium]|nr:ORF6N domain-containing protein [Planctomycetota bacterium]